jgi:hypothetical protein
MLPEAKALAVCRGLCASRKRVETVSMQILGDVATTLRSRTCFSGGSVYRVLKLLRTSLCDLILAKSTVLTRKEWRVPAPGEPRDNFVALVRGKRVEVAVQDALDG